MTDHPVVKSALLHSRVKDPETGIAIFHDELSENEQYEFLIQEVLSILTEASFDLRMRLVEWKLKLGETVLHNGLYQRYAHQNNKKILERLCRDVQLSIREVYYCIQFARQVEEVGSLDQWLEEHPLDKTISWTQVKRLLPAEKAPPPDDYPEVYRDWKEAINLARRRVGKAWRKYDQMRLEEYLSHTNTTPRPFQHGEDGTDTDGSGE